MPSYFASKCKCFPCFSFCSSQHPETQALPCHTRAGSCRAGRGGLLGRHPPVTATQRGSSAACTGSINVKAGQGQAGHKLSEGSLLNTHNAHHGNAHGLCRDVVVGENLPRELPCDPSWAEEQQPVVMRSKAQAAFLLTISLLRMCGCVLEGRGSCCSCKSMGAFASHPNAAYQSGAEHGCRAGSISVGGFLWEHPLLFLFLKLQS